MFAASTTSGLFASDPGQAPLSDPSLQHGKAPCSSSYHRYHRGASQPDSAADGCLLRPTTRYPHLYSVVAMTTRLQIAAPSSATASLPDGSCPQCPSRCPASSRLCRPVPCLAVGREGRHHCQNPRAVACCYHSKHLVASAWGAALLPHSVLQTHGVCRQWTGIDSCV